MVYETQFETKQLGICPNCGAVHAFLPDRPDILAKRKCEICGTAGTDFIITEPMAELYRRRSYENLGTEKRFIKEFITDVKQKGLYTEPKTSDPVLLKKAEEYNNELTERLMYDLEVVEKANNSPACPKCGSHAIGQISGTKKALGWATLGVFSSNVRNNHYCKDCGYKW